MTNKMKKKAIAIVAHNEKKNTLLEWAKANREELSRHRLIGTSNTARLLTSVLEIEVEPFGHGPNGGDILLAAKILQNEVEKLIFFVDLQSPHGHEHDIQTLIRTATINNIPIALNPATATLIIHEQDAGKE
ncbi:MAG: methylglyoxal synthase [Bacteroidales bacterium]|jgi:methylglyoxal synthase|nr:methylglyoxal synthase [Bacteroidales bacterium]MDD2570061.1 methylglyoxal synthase [Bacteroidales bacterium]MDD2812381.1 methylglyoxal synthase [Bacteroidales bacterium]MDD3384868.1 methylglyoxal synthase [Bacteroidales bacterium]MDD3811759.1 methylglyoxal synthase [Bacteroidales bacterium]